MVSRPDTPERLFIPLNALMSVHVENLESGVFPAASIREKKSKAAVLLPLVLFRSKWPDWSIAFREFLIAARPAGSSSAL
jgi:hypothetical protein